MSDPEVFPTKESLFIRSANNVEVIDDPPPGMWGIRKGRFMTVEIKADLAPKDAARLLKLAREIGAEVRARNGELPAECQGEMPVRFLKLPTETQE